MAFSLKRDYNIYVSKAPQASADSTNTVQLLVSDFSFNQNSALLEVKRDTLSSTQERTIDPYISNLSAVSFSLDTYILPLVDTNVTSPEEYLWTSLMGNDSIAGSPNSTPTSSTIDFAEGNVGSLHELTIWFKDPNTPDLSYRLDNAIIDTAKITFDINNIAMVSWEGRALNITKNSSEPSGAVDRTTANNYLKNKLSTITLSINSGATTYTVALTGGDINYNNNSQFYSRTQIGKTTTPVGHYTGSRKISGNLDFYTKQGTNLSADLFNDILSNASSDTYESSYEADITINIGGTTAPYIQVKVPRAIMQIPRLNFSDIISMSVPFIAQEGTSFYNSIIYYA